MKGLKEYQERTKTKYKAERSMKIDGHEVAWMRYKGTDINGKEYSGHELMCEHSFQFDKKETKFIAKTGDDRNCRYLAAARMLRYAEVLEELKKDPKLKSSWLGTSMLGSSEEPELVQKIEIGRASC